MSSSYRSFIKPYPSRRSARREGGVRLLFRNTNTGWMNAVLLDLSNGFTLRVGAGQEGSFDPHSVMPLPARSIPALKGEPLGSVQGRNRPCIQKTNSLFREVREEGRIIRPSFRNAFTSSINASLERGTSRVGAGQEQALHTKDKFLI
jgi:hypothetical protein